MLGDGKRQQRKKWEGKDWLGKREEGTPPWDSGKLISVWPTQKWGISSIGGDV